MRQIRRQAKSGDSIIEVLLAVAIFSAIAVTSVAIMNKGLSSAQTALESTMVRTELDAQAEAIRFIEQAYETNSRGIIGSQWGTILGGAIAPDDGDTDSDYNKLKSAINGDTACPTETDFLPDGKYFLYDGSAIKRDPQLSTTSIPSATSGGLWFAVVKNNSEDDIEKIEYFDFYISACWDALNSPMPAKRTTIIRLHNPDYETTSSTPETPDYTLPLVVKFRSGFSSSTETWDLYKNSVLQKKNMAGTDEYGYTAKSKSWNDGETPPDVSEFEFNVGIFSAEREGWIFEGWSQEGGDLSAGYKCESSGVCSWESGEIIYRAKWKAADQFCLRFYDGATQISGLPDDCSSPFQELPSHSKSGHKLLGWAIGSNVYAVGSKPTINVSNTDYDNYETIPSSGAKKYYKRVKSVWAVTFSKTNLKVLLTYDIASTSGDKNLKKLAIVAYSNKGESWLLGLDESDTDIYIGSNRIVKKLDGKDTQKLAGAKGTYNCWVHEDIRVTSLPDTLVCNIKGNNMKYGSTAQFFVFNDQVYNRDFYVSIWADGDTSQTKMKINGNQAATDNRSNGNESVRIYQENSLIETINYVNATNFDNDGTVCWHVAAIKSSGSGSNYVSIINAADDSATNASDCAKRGYELYNSI